MKEPIFRSETMRRLLVGVSAVVLILSSIGVGLESEASYRREASSAALGQARVLAETVTAALAFGDQAALRSYVGALRTNEAVDAVGVYDQQGHLAAGFTRSVLADHLDRTINPRRDPGRVVVTAPVRQDGTWLGTVYVRDRTESLGRRLGRYAGAGLLGLMAAMMFLVMALDALSLRRANRALMTQIVERARAEEALRQSQKMEAVGRLTGGIAHDFNNMLAVVIGNLELMTRRRLFEDPTAARMAENAIEAARRASELTQRLLAFSRLQPLKPTSVDIAKVVSDITNLIRRTLGETIEVETVAAAGLWRAHIDASQLEAAIVNLAINARDAMPAGGKLTFETSNIYLDRDYAAGDADIHPGQYVLLAITDTGAGIAPGILDQIFEPFFTTKPAGMGTGLGLSQVHGFIKQSGGHLKIYSEVGVGTTVKLYLPRSTAEAEPPAHTVRAPRPGERRGVTVLLVEDEDGVREFAAEALAELGYDVIAASGPSAALTLIGQHPDIGLMLTDVMMPEMNGRVLADEARRRLPALKVVYMTGYSRNAIVHNGVLDAGTHLVSKPFTLTQLGDELDAALDERR